MIKADAAYGTGPLLSWMVKKAIEPYVPVWDESQRKDDTFSSNDFHWDEAADDIAAHEDMRFSASGGSSGRLATGH